MLFSDRFSTFILFFSPSKFCLHIVIRPFPICSCFWITTFLRARIRFRVDSMHISILSSSIFLAYFPSASSSLLAMRIIYLLSRHPSQVIKKFVDKSRFFRLVIWVPYCIQVWTLILQFILSQRTRLKIDTAGYIKERLLIVATRNSIFKIEMSFFVKLFVIFFQYQAFESCVSDSCNFR